MQRSYSDLAKPVTVQVLALRGNQSYNPDIVSSLNGLPFNIWPKCVKW
jgi:hypothetical protein